MREKGLCMRRALLLEKAAYIMLGSRVPNLLVYTSLWAENAKTFENCTTCEQLYKHI